MQGSQSAGSPGVREGRIAIRSGGADARDAASSARSYAFQGSRRWCLLPSSRRRKRCYPRSLRASRWATERRSGGAAAEGRLPAPADPNGGRSSSRLGAQRHRDAGAGPPLERHDRVRQPADRVREQRPGLAHLLRDAPPRSAVRKAQRLDRHRDSGVYPRWYEFALLPPIDLATRRCRSRSRALQFAIAPAGGEQARPRPWCVEASSPRASPPAAGVPSRATGRSGSRRGSASCRPRRSRASA